jgi:hypothetical protein
VTRRAVPPFPREYRGWTIWPRNAYGMYTATNYGGGYLQVAADTLAGVKRCISHEIAHPR